MSKTADGLMMSDFIVRPHATSGREWRDADFAPLMVNLPGGEFTMGETPGDKFAGDTERPVHRVAISYAFALARGPVTVAEYCSFRPAHAVGEPDAWPVVQVNWNDAQEYCAWLTKSIGRLYRLPSEAEWEFACRAGSTRSFHTGNEITPANANYLYDEDGQRIGPGKRTKVGQYPPNAFGLCDLHGNVCEWVEDAWHPDYHLAPGNGSARIGSGEPLRVIRGGAWDYLPRLLRSSWRDGLPTDQQRDNLGFRVATTDVPN
jgi:formylglycine-generating enzyme required for sulfatase activity